VGRSLGVAMSWKAGVRKEGNQVRLRRSSLKLTMASNYGPKPNDREVSPTSSPRQGENRLVRWPARLQVKIA